MRLFNPIIQSDKFLLYKVLFKNNVCFYIDVGSPCFFERNRQVRKKTFFLVCKGTDK